ncbi:hypothetical protein MBANPS3_006316 [Mucor bainieri]
MRYSPTLLCLLVLALLAVSIRAAPAETFSGDVSSNAAGKSDNHADSTNLNLKNTEDVQELEKEVLHKIQKLRSEVVRRINEFEANAGLLKGTPARLDMVTKYISKDVKIGRAKKGTPKRYLHLLKQVDNLLSQASEPNKWATSIVDLVNRVRDQVVGFARPPRMQQHHNR